AGDHEGGYWRRLAAPADARRVSARPGGVEEEVDRLTRLVENLLLLARADTGQPLVQRESVELGALLRVLSDQVQPLVAAKELTLAVQAPARLAVSGDTDKLLRLFLN